MLEVVVLVVVGMLKLKVIEAGLGRVDEAVLGALLKLTLGSGEELMQLSRELAQTDWGWFLKVYHVQS